MSLARAGDLNSLKKLKAADLIDLDVTVIAAAVEGEASSSSDEPLSSGCVNIDVLKWLCDVEPKIVRMSPLLIARLTRLASLSASNPNTRSPPGLHPPTALWRAQPLDASVFAAATSAGVKNIKANVLSWLIERTCPMGAPAEQAEAFMAVSLRCKASEMRALHAAGCAWDTTTIGGILTAEIGDSGFELLEPKARPYISEADRLEKLSFALDNGCATGSAETQAQLVGCAASLGGHKVLTALHEASFEADVQCVRVAVMKASEPLLRFLLQPASRARKAWPVLTKDEKSELPALFATERREHYYSIKTLPDAATLLRRAGCSFSADDASRLVKLVGDSENHDATSVEDVTKRLQRAGLPLNADADVAAAAALRPRLGHEVLRALHGLKPPCPMDERCISPWNLASWEYAADAGVAWASETPCREFEERLRKFDSALDDGERSMIELRD
jgi:hypothetical protein